MFNFVSRLVVYTKIRAIRVFVLKKIMKFVCVQCESNTNNYELGHDGKTQKASTNLQIIIKLKIHL